MSTAVFGAPGFKARSGRTVMQGEDGTVTFHLGNGYLGADVAMDAEEFFQAKRDAELGRVRDPLDPHYVTYAVADDRVYVIDERDGQKITALRDDAGSFEPNSLFRGHFKAAWAYFAAHPVREPWEDAQRGDVWVITTPVLEESVAATWTGSRFAIPDGTFTEYVGVNSVTSAELVWRAGAR